MSWPYVDPRLPILTGDNAVDVAALWKALYALERDRAKKYSISGGVASYQVGTWTPVDLSGAGLGFTAVTASYTKIGRLVTLQAILTYPVTGSGLQPIIGGFPFTSNAANNSTSKLLSNSAVGVQMVVFGSASGGALYNALGGAALTNAQMTGATVILTQSYET